MDSEVVVKSNGELRMTFEVFKQLNKYDVIEHLQHRVVSTVPTPLTVIGTGLGSVKQNDDS